MNATFDGRGIRNARDTRHSPLVLRFSNRTPPQRRQIIVNSSADFDFLILLCPPTFFVGDGGHQFWGLGPPNS
jgi:hypothetical protein